MLFKNPLIYLIKHYRKIHLVVSVLLIMLIIETTKILSLFNTYVNNGWYRDTSDLISQYLPFDYFALIIAITLLFILLLFIFIKGKGNIGYYLLSIISMIVILVFTNIQYGVLEIIGTSSIGASTIRLSRDLVFTNLILEYTIMLVSIVRTFGFNVKNIDFNSARDVNFSGDRELEFNVGIDKEDIKEKLNNRIFNVKSFIKEHFLIFILIMLVVVVLVGYNGYNYIIYYFETTDSIIYNGINVTVNNSYKTIYDSNYSNIDDEAYYYLVIDVNLETTVTGLSLTNADFKLRIGDLEYTPISSIDMIDIGTVYNRNTIQVGSENNYILVFEASGNISDARLSMLNKEEEILLDVINLDMNNDIYEFEFNKENEFIDSLLSEYTIDFYNYSFMESYSDTNYFCLQYNCTYVTHYNYSDLLNEYVFMKLSVKSDIYMYTYDLLKNNLYVIAKDEFGESYYFNLKYRGADFNTNNNGIIYFEIKDDVMNFETIELVFKVRGQTYIVK